MSNNAPIAKNGLDVDTASLERLLADLLNKNRIPEDIKIVSRTSNHKGTFPAEVVTCKICTNKVTTLLCKYAPKGSKRYWSIKYEGEVYRILKGDLPLSKIKCYGTFYVEGNNSVETCVVLEYLDNSEQLIHKEPVAFIKAAEWIANFHNHFESKILPG